MNRSVLDSLYETAATNPSTNGACQMPNAYSNPFEADDSVYNGYNHNMMYYRSLAAQQSYMQPAAFMQQQGQSMTVYDSIPHQQPQFTEKNYQQQHSSPYIDVSKNMALIELPVQQQQQQKPMFGYHSTATFSNPFSE